MRNPVRKPTPILRLPVEVTNDSIRAVEAEARALLGDHGTRLVVDLADTAFLGSAGLGLLVKVGKRLHDQGGAISLARPRPPVAKLLRAVGLETVLPSFSKLEAAMAHVEPPSAP